MVKVGLPFLAIIFGAIGFVGLFVIPSIVKRIINQKVVLQEGSVLYPFWRDLPLPVFHKFYFYNITNPKEVENHGDKPILSEIGPFTYRVRAAKSPFVNGNGTISFRQTKRWFFDREKSIMDESVIIHTINAPLVITLSIFARVSPEVQKLIEDALSLLDHGFIIKKSVKELTFSGYKDILMTLGPFIDPEATAGYNGRFGYFHHKNGSDDGLFTVYSGVSDMTKINLLTRINGLERLNIWADEPGIDYCNRFNDSSLGEIFPSMRDNPTRTIKIFTPDLSRTLSLSYQKTHYLFKGLETWRYSFSPNNFANSTSYPLNKCFISRMNSHTFDGSNGTLPSGVFDASTANFGFPIFMSLPHFYGADPYYLSKVKGLSPNESIHSTWFEIEPTSGATAATTVRLQLNLGVMNSHLFKRRHRMPNIVFPALWMEVETSLTPDIVEKLVFANRILSLVPTLVFAIGVGLSGLFLFIASLQLIVPQRRIRFVSCLNLLTCHLYKSVKDDEQTILDADEINDNRGETLTN